MPAPTAARKALAVVKLTLAVAVAGLLLAGMLLPFAGGVGIAARNSVQAFDDQPCDVTATTPAQASVIYAVNGKPIARFYSQNREIVPLAKIAPVARKAVVAIEDRRFYEHHGVDLQATIRALIENSRSGGVVQGGSTLTQQYVKQVRLYSATTVAQQRAAVAQTTARKLIEAKCALSLEQKLSKDQILERYLNIAYFGSGAYGIQTAARTYFNKSAATLTLPESALLAGLVQSPSRYDPHLDRKAATTRRNTVLDEMQSLGYLTAKQNVQAKAVPVVVKPRRSSSKDCANAYRTVANVGFFCDYVKSYLGRHGYPAKRLESGGLKIYTTIDPSVQQHVMSALDVNIWRGRKSAAVMNVIEPKTGKVRAMGVSRVYGQRRFQTVNPLPTRASAGAGSTYKVFTLLSALRAKVPLRDFTIKVGNTYKASICKNGNEPYTVKNAGEYREGAYNLEVATYESVNTFFVALLDQQFDCDLKDPVDTAIAMGLDSYRPFRSETVRGKSASFTLGPKATSPLDLASAYGTLAAEGMYCPPTPIERIVGPDGKELGLEAARCQQRVDRAIANTVTNVLEKDTSNPNGTATVAAMPYGPVAGKTGTASSDKRYGQENSSAWFVGYTPDYVASVAVFNPSNTSSPILDVPDREGSDVFGAYSAGIWKRAMEPVLAGRSWQFPPEDPTVVNGNSVPVPSVVGQDLGTATQILANAGFGIEVASERKDAPLPPDRIAEQSPSSRALPGQKITVYLSTGQAPKPAAEPTQRGGDPGPPGHRRGG
jgi:membrane peptidoglycan carboxypeptidase